MIFDIFLIAFQQVSVTGVGMFSMNYIRCHVRNLLWDSLLPSLVVPRQSKVIHICPWLKGTLFSVNIDSI